MRDFFSRLAEVFRGKPRKGGLPRLPAHPRNTAFSFSSIRARSSGPNGYCGKRGLPWRSKGLPPNCVRDATRSSSFDLMQEPLIRNALGSRPPCSRSSPSPCAIPCSNPYRCSMCRITAEPVHGAGREHENHRGTRHGENRLRRRSGGGCPDVPYLAALLDGAMHRRGRGAAGQGADAVFLLAATRI